MTSGAPTETRPTVLVVEDDSAIRRGLVDALRFAGYTVLEAADGTAGLATALEGAVDLVLLDVMMPKRSGFDVLQALRASRPTLPVIMVTARGAEEDRVRGLAEGADDYVVKPFSARELLARVEAVLRRSPQRAGDVRLVALNGRTIDLERREVRGGGDTGDGSLTEREAAILRYLAEHRDRAVDREELLRHVWGLNPKGIQTRTVDMHVARLREKIEHDPADPGIVVTVRGKGYMLGADVEARGS
jgi:DNA-binding response OmpR family regulator